MIDKQNLNLKLRTQRAIAFGLAVGMSGFMATACKPTGTSSASGLKIGSLLPATGDLASIGQGMVRAVPILVDTVNACGGVNGEPVSLISVDDQTDPKAGAEGMTKLAEVDKVAGVVGSFASSVSSAAVDIAVRNKVMLISPGSTSPVFTDRAKKGDFQGYWARTAPPDSYQGPALAQLAINKGLKRVSTLVINNDYGVGFEKAFVAAFKKLGGTVVNEAKPTRYDPKATTFATEVTTAFQDKPQGVLSVLYTETGSLIIKSAYEQGLSKGVTILLTDGMYSADFPAQVGQAADGKYIAAGVLGTVPGADGKALADFTTKWKAKYNQDVSAFAPHAWDAAALLVLAAQAGKANTGEAIQANLKKVANGPGKEVSDVCEGLALLKKGETINYQGASSNVDIDANGDVSGVYDVWTVKDDGKLAVTDKVKPSL